MKTSGLDMQWTMSTSGWAWLTWATDDGLLKVRTSYIAHGLESLLRAAVDLQRGSSGTIAWLSDEPSAHVFLFRGAAEYLRVDIIYIPNEAAEDPWKDAERRWAGNLRVEEITQAATRMAQAVWDKHGEPGYQQLWDGKPFPREELLILRGERP